MLRDSHAMADEPESPRSYRRTSLTDSEPETPRGGSAGKSGMEVWGVGAASRGSVGRDARAAELQDCTSSDGCSPRSDI
eukprot:5648804-Prymnesium_polylepis.1